VKEAHGESERAGSWWWLIVMAAQWQVQIVQLGTSCLQQGA
jgi:hypothetical protein